MSWTSFLMGFPFCSDQKFDKSFNRLLKISRCYCSDSQKSLPLNCSSRKPSGLYFRDFGIKFSSIKLPIPALWLYFLSFFCKGAGSENKIFDLFWVSPSRGEASTVGISSTDGKSSLWLFSSCLLEYGFGKSKLSWSVMRNVHERIER